MKQRPTPHPAPRGLKNLLPGLLLAPALAALALLLYFFPGPHREGPQRETALLITANTLRRWGVSSAVTFAAGPEGTLLEVATPLGDTNYRTAYYVYKGQFYEHLYRPDAPFDPALGSPLAPAEAFFARLDDQLLTLTLAGAEGEENTLHLFLPEWKGGGL